MNDTDQPVSPEIQYEPQAPPIPVSYVSIHTGFTGAAQHPPPPPLFLCVRLREFDTIRDVQRIPSRSSSEPFCISVADMFVLCWLKNELRSRCAADNQVRAVISLLTLQKCSHSPVCDNERTFVTVYHYRSP